MDLELIVLKYQTPFLIVIIAVEALLSSYFKTSAYHLKDTLNNVLFTCINFGLDLLMKGANIAVLFFCYQFAFF